MKHFLSFVMTLWAASQVAVATDYYVATTGNNSNSGTTPSAPLLTVTKAASKVKAGDVVYIAEGTYSEMDITPANSGSAAGYIVFCPLNDSAKVVFSSADGMSDDVSKSVFKLTSKSYVCLRGLEFRRITYLKSAIQMGGAKHCVVTDCVVDTMGTSETASYGGTASIWMSNATNCTVQNNLFLNIYGDGISLSERASANLCCNNTFSGMKGKARTWSTSMFSSGITVQGVSDELVHGYNLICFNNFVDGQDGIWLDRGASSNAMVRNTGTGGQRLIFNESRCTNNLVQENIAINATQSGFRSALYDDTDFSAETRWVGNVAFGCPYGFYIDKSNGNELVGNIVYRSTTYSLVYSQKAIEGGASTFSNNLWYAPSLGLQFLYGGKKMKGAAFATSSGETDGIYSSDPLFASIRAPYDFTLKATSPAKGAGYDGVDMGAYAVYAHRDVGHGLAAGHCSESMPYFDTVLSEAEQGETATIRVVLPRAAAEATTLTLTPMAGEAREGVDYTLSSPSITIASGRLYATATISFVRRSDVRSKLILFGLTDAEGNVVGSAPYKAFVIAGADITGITQPGNNHADSHAGPRKYIRDGQLIISRGGKWYNTAGQQL